MEIVCQIHNNNTGLTIRLPMHDSHYLPNIPHHHTFTHGHIIEAAPISEDWTIHLANLPPDTKWVFSHTDIQGQGPLLAKTIAHKPIIAVSNGSYKDQQGTATWVFYKPSNLSMAISHGTLTTLGSQDTQGSYQSKLAGIYGIITTIATLCQFYQIQHGTGQVICNGDLPSNAAFTTG